jgi:hypothetical protein
MLLIVCFLVSTSKIPKTINQKDIDLEKLVVSSIMLGYFHLDCGWQLTTITSNQQKQQLCYYGLNSA